MGIKQKVKESIGEVSDRYYLMRAKSVEIKKYHDTRRKKILAQRTLSDQERKEIDAFYKKNYGGEKFRIHGINTIVPFQENLM